MDPQQYKEFVNYCNKLRCPLCKSQLDGVIKYDFADLYCVSNNQEYMCILSSPDDDFDVEQFIYWYPQYQYTICVANLNNGQYRTTVDRYSLDYVPRLRVQSKKEIFRHVGGQIPFFRSKKSEEELLKKLKIYTIFS